MSINQRPILLRKGNIKIYIYKEYYFFTVPYYSMKLKLYKEDVLEFLKNPIDNFLYGKSCGNCMNDCDRDIIIEFLRKRIGIKKYKTVSRCIIYSKKDRLIDNLNLFTINELYEYISK